VIQVEQPTEDDDLKRFVLLMEGAKSIPKWHSRWSQKEKTLAIWKAIQSEETSPLTKDSKVESVGQRFYFLIFSEQINPPNEILLRYW
jgi:hypothetical protein